MLEHYFVKPSTIDKIRASSLGSKIESYVEWMEVHGYARPTALRRVPLLFHFAEFVQERGCTEIGQRLEQHTVHDAENTVFAPTAAARVIRAIAVNKGARLSRRRVYFVSAHRDSSVGHCLLFLTFSDAFLSR